MYKTIIILRLTFKYTFRHFVITRKKLNTKNRLFIMVENCFYASVRFYSLYFFSRQKGQKKTPLSHTFEKYVYIYFIFGVCVILLCFYTTKRARSGAIFQKIVSKKNRVKKTLFFFHYIVG